MAILSLPTNPGGGFEFPIGSVYNARLHHFMGEVIHMQSNLLRFVYLVCIILFFGCNGDNGVTPPVTNNVTITSITPNVLSLGAQGVTIEITGSGFASVTAVDLGAGINIVSRDVPNTTRIELVVNVAKSAAPGDRTVTVSTSSTTGSLAAGLTVSNNNAPVAKFDVSPSQGTISSLFVFDASTSIDGDGTIAAYKWQISDGANPKGRKVQHQFSAKGDFTVILTITDNKGGESTMQKSITVGDNLPPAADFSLTPTSGSNLTLFSFDASGSADPDGEIKSYRWDFGDNKVDQGIRVTHKYNQAGTYQVQLSVKDSKDAVTIAKRNIPVTFFDVDKARKDMTETITDFLRLFGDQENLSASEIVVGFSKSPSCPGRAREINIIENEQATIRTSGVRAISVTITSVGERAGTAIASAEFYGVTYDGDDYDGFATHHLSMVNEDGSWLICNFVLTPDGAGLPIFP